MDMTLDEFEAEVSQQFDELPEEVVGGLENVVFVVEDRPGDGAPDAFSVVCSSSGGGCFFCHIIL